MTIRLPGGLRIVPIDLPRAFREGTIAVVVVTLAVLIIDGIGFRQSLPGEYLDYYTAPLWPRTAAMCLRSAGEEVVIRLGLLTLLVWLAARDVRQPGWRTAAAAIGLSQLVLTWALVVQYPVWGLLRFWAVGCVWGWLYWRNGWLTALAGHGSVHLLLDPLLRKALMATA